ncbi:MAG: Rrf2 family transcriptional regulator [Acidobacteriota bacterium]
MRISRKAGYGLLALTYLARKGEGHICYRNEIACRFHISRAVLAKILQSLRRSGILRSHLGSHGGYSLARNPAKISLAEVLEALGADVQMPRQRSTRHSEPSLAARVATGLQRVGKDVQRLFSRVSLKDLAGD